MYYNFNILKFLGVDIMIQKVEIKRDISKAELLWEQLWRQWRDGKIITPLDELLTYTSIVQDGGHIRLFITLQCKEKALLFIKGLKGILPNKLYKNLQKAYSIFCSNENGIINKHANRIAIKYL